MEFFRLDYPFQAISSNFGFSWQLSSPQGPNRQILDWIYSFQAISSNFGFSWQLSSPQGPNRQKFQTGFIHFRQFPATLGFSWQKSLQSPENSKFLFWIYPFHAISSNFAFSWQKSPIEPNRELFQTGFIHFRQFPATLPLAGRKATPSSSQTDTFFRLELSISGNFQQFWFQLVENASS